MFHAYFNSESLQYPFKKCFLKLVFGALCNMNDPRVLLRDLLEAIKESLFFILATICDVLFYKNKTKKKTG